MVRLDDNKNAIRNPSEGVWELVSTQGGPVEVFKTRAQAVERAHEVELWKIRRIKRLEQLYSRYQNLSLYGVY